MEKKYTRPTRDEYFMEITKTIGKRATCDENRNGCSITKNNRLLVTWYVWSPIGFPHCDDIWHQFKQMTHEDGSVTNHCMRTIHAEQNAICQAAKNGISIEWATLYCEKTPCRTCAMLIISCGIRRVVAEKKYHAWAESETMFKEAGVELIYFDNSVEQYDKQ